MRKIVIGVCCVVLSALAISAWQNVFAVKSVQPEKSGQKTEQTAQELVQSGTTTPQRQPIDGAAPSLDKEVVQESELIAVGECVGLQSSWADDGRRLVTRATIQVSEVLKGDEQSTVSVELLGGIDANRRIPVAMRYPGAAQMMEGEKVVVFLNREATDSASFSITNDPNGKFSINTDSSGQEFVSRDYIQRDDSAAAKVNRENASALTANVKPGISLDEFRSQVQNFLQ